VRWLECSTEAEAEAVDAVAEAFSRWGQGVAIEEPVVSSRDGDEYAIDPTRLVVVKTYLPVDDQADERRARLAEATWHLGRLRSVTPLRVRPLEEADWANAWKEHFYVQRVGQRLVIVPSWREFEAGPTDVPLLLDPGMAFGTGLHPTTRLCLRAVEEVLVPGARVLDLGTGSGILAIAAVKLGAERVVGLDLESVAVEVARDNATRNGVAERFEVARGSLPAPLAPPAGFDLALANITIRALLGLHEGVMQALRPGGLAVFSGILAVDAPRFIAALEQGGWAHERTDQDSDWVALLAHKADQR
jgi:ribosomal protein L11 methyltransferase